MKEKKKGTFDWQKVGLIVLCVVLALILVGGIFATTYVHHLLSMIDRVDSSYDDTLSPEEMASAMTEEPEETDYTGEVEDPDDVILDTVDSSLLDGDNDGIVNILLVGQDRREGEPRQRSDVMILCTFNTNNRSLTMTSFLRDTYVYIPGYGNNKLNAAFCWGGFSLLNETLAVNFGVHVDGNVEIDFTGFTDLIDLLGGVDVELTQKEANYLNKNTGFEYNKGETWNLTAGVNHLNGAQALAYSRIRKIDSDFGRTQRQRTVLMALVEAYKDQSLNSMVALMDDVLPMVTTNMTNAEILTYVVSLFPLLAEAELNTQHIPADGTYTDKSITGVGACLVPDLAANRDILAEILYND